MNWFFAQDLLIAHLLLPDSNPIFFFHPVTVESTGAAKPNEIFTESIDILMAKCQKHLTELNAMEM